MAKKSRYMISRRINRGGMAEIFLGKLVGEQGFVRLCAIKRILPHYAAEKEFVQMFRDEANICKRLSHANIVQVYSFEELDNSYALIMEYVDGADLRSVLSSCEKARTRLSVPMVLFIGSNIARGLHYAHTKVDEVSGLALEIVHRDVSPQNIMISYEGEVKITDFGIADAESKVSETKPGIVKGKYSYMSPEQVNAEKLDARTDVFSLAIVVWEALAMRRLFAGDTEVQTIKLVQECQLPFKLSELNPKVDAELEALILKGLAKDRRNRFQSAAEFEEALARYLHSRYPDFTASKLGGFLKELFAAKRESSKLEIRRALTQPDANPKEIARKAELPLPDADPLPAKPDAKPAEAAERPTPPTQEREPETSTAVQPSPAKAAPQAPLVLARPPGKPKADTSRQWMIQQRQPQGRSSAPSVLGLLAAAAIVVVTAAIGVHMKSRAPTFGMLNLATTPETVLLTIDDQEVSGNRQYIQTPQAIKLQPGNHTLVAQRAGYLPESRTFTIRNGDNTTLDKVVLRRDPRHVPSPVRILVSRDRQLPITVDQGLYQITAPVFIDDLSYGDTHTVVVFPYGRDDPQNAFKCAFRPLSTDSRAPFVLTLADTADGKWRCLIKGP